MKKKKIERVPFIGLDKTIRKKGILYVGITKIKKIDGEMHLFLEVYRNRAKDKDKPVIRYVADKKDWAIYDTRFESWSHRKIKSHDWSDGLVWYDALPLDHSIYNQQTKSKINVLASDDDLKRIKKFFDGLTSYTSIYDQWYDIVARYEDHCNWKKSVRASQLRNERLNARTNAIEELDEKTIGEYADRILLGRKHYIYYVKKGARASIACSHCGWVTTGRYKVGDTYESQFESFVEEPREGTKAICPRCKEKGIYKAAGRNHKDKDFTVHLWMISKYLDTGACLRYIEITKRFHLDAIEKELIGARELIAVTEIARTYVKDGKTQTDFHKHNPYVGGDFWDDVNLYGMANITIDRAKVYNPSWDNLKGTCLQYCAAYEYYRHEHGEINLRRYAEDYIKLPQLEMLVKMKLFDIVKEGYYSLDKSATTPEGLLKIRKERLRYLSSKDGDIAIWNVLKLEKELNENWTTEQIENLAYLRIINMDQVKSCMRFISLQKFLNYIAAYAGCDYHAECSNARHQMAHEAVEYMDYLTLRHQLGYDLTNTVYLHPRDLEAAHQKMIEEADKKNIDKRIMEAEEKFSQIKKEYRKLRKKYYFENDSYIIRPARSAGEIVREGRILHHCVGGDNYLQSHNEGRSFILFLRFKKKAESPYVTIEISSKQDAIRQWYGAYDKKPDEENIKKLLEGYIKELKDKAITA